MSLFVFKSRNSEPNFKVIEDFYQNISKLLSLDKYISRKEFSPYVEKAQKSYSDLNVLESNKMLFTWCKKNKCDYKSISTYLRAYSNVESLIEKHNKAFVEKHLKTDKNYLDNLLKDLDSKIILDDDQKRIVLNDEDYTLVIAGAGKTTTLAAKAKYLVEKQNINPSKILIVSFTKQATNELKERFQRLNIPANISTFHSIGNTIIKQTTGKHSIKSTGFMFEVLREYLMTKIEDETFIKKITIFFASYINIPFDEQQSLDLYKRILEKNDFATLKNDLNNYTNQLKKSKITINDEKVRSIQECEIANFLYINGIDYEYEPIYPYCLAGSSKPYTPDFKIWQNDKVSYIEHFGISESGTNWRFTEEELRTYKKHINDKIKLHRIHNTDLIYTFSKYNDKESLISHLKKELLNHNYKLEQRNTTEIYKEIAQRAEERYFTKLIQLLCDFINRFKTNGYKEEKFLDFMTSARERKDERTLLFLDIARQCYRYYENKLNEEHAIDFEDMINNASDILDEKINSGEKLPYDYIFVDEYQDISLQRFNLAEKLSQCSDAKIIAVGDDWQSIFRFSGADITLFTDFEQKMGYGQILRLNQTHRNSQELIDIAGSFIMKNNLQKKKNLVSQKHLSDPVIIMSYDDTYDKQHDKNGPYYRLGEAIEEALDDIESKFGPESDVLLLGRYNFDGKNLNRLNTMFLCTSDNRIKSLAHPKLKIKFMTAHSSKGTGANNVIVINGKDDILGFPSKIEDDPIMKLVLNEAKEIEFAEERRLFYVALTRTKNSVYLITPKTKPSQFISELMENHKNIVLNGPSLEHLDYQNFRYKCPICGYPLQIRRKKLKTPKDSLDLYICSNDPEVCGFVTNDVSGGKMSIQKCPQCESGYLIVKRIKDKDGHVTAGRMLGCTNYKNDKTGCNYYIPSQDFSVSQEIMSRNQRLYEQKGKKIPLEQCVLAGYPIKDLLKLIANLTSFDNFKFTKPQLVEYLIGKESKAFSFFELDKKKEFGCIKEKHQKLLFAIIDVLLDFGFLLPLNDEYRHIFFSGIQINDNFTRQIFEQFVYKNT